MTKRILDASLNEYYQYFSGFAYFLPSVGESHESKVAFNKNHSTCIILIDRCASTFLQKKLQEAGFHLIINNEVQKATISSVTTFLRNPNDRYLSALKRVSLHLDSWCGPSLAKKILKDSLSSNHFILSDHCCPQHIYLDVFDNIKEIKYLIVENNIQDQLKTYLNIDILDNKKVHTSKSFECLNLDLIKICENLFSKYCLNNKEFYSLYEKDWDLYNFAIKELE